MGPKRNIGPGFIYIYSIIIETTYATDVLAIVKYLAYEEVLSFSCSLKQKDFEMKAYWLRKRIPHAISGLEIM